MPAVVWARRDFVGEQPPITQHEELDAQHTPIVEPSSYGNRRFTRSVGQSARNTRGNDAYVQNPVGMAVLRQRPCHDFAIEAARDDAGQFQLEIQPLLQHAGFAAELLERLLRIGRAAHAGLPLAVVSQPATLENTGQQMRQAFTEILPAADNLERCDLQPGRGEKLLLGDAVLGHRDAVDADETHAYPVQLDRLSAAGLTIMCCAR